VFRHQLMQQRSVNFNSLLTNLFSAFFSLLLSATPLDCENFVIQVVYVSKRNIGNESILSYCNSEKASYNFKAYGE